MPQFIRDFIEKTKSKYSSVPPQELKTVPQPPLELPIPPETELIPLPAPKDLQISDIGLRKAVEQRRSHRAYTGKALSIEELSYLLWMTQGVKKVSPRPVTLRNVPSAGARHAFETYLLVNAVDGLTPGLYRFAAIEHALVRIDAPGTINADVTRACYEQGQVASSAVTFLWAAVSERMTWRYVERGFRYLLLDAGHVCQNLYLAAEAVHCGVCAIAAYDDDEINTVLCLDGESQWVIYVASLGKINHE